MKKYDVKLTPRQIKALIIVLDHVLENETFEEMFNDDNDLGRIIRAKTELEKARDEFTNKGET